MEARELARGDGPPDGVHEGRPRRHFQATTAEGKVVDRWTTTGMLYASAASNEAGYITHKAMRSLGMLVFDNQARV